jgi:uncharacterized protein (DUF2141 family)
MRAKLIGLILAMLCIPLSGICGSLEVSITGIQNAKGQILVGVYNIKDTFPKTGSEFKGMIIKPVKGKTSVIIKDLPAGTYAVAIFHDEKKNGKLDKNFLGIPKEGYGFSNIAKGLGAPSFEKASFLLETADKQISISMR